MKTDREKQELKGQVKSIQVESIHYEVNEEGQTIEMPGYSLTTIFNRDGWIIEQFHPNPDVSKWQIVYDYSEAGKLKAMRSYNNSKVLVGKWKYIYDDKGRLTAEQYKDQDGEITMSVTYIYHNEDKKLKIQEFSFIEGAGMMFGMEGATSGIGYVRITKSETRYNDRGEEIELKIFNDDGELVGRMELTRDAQGNVIEETHYHGDIVEFSPFAPDSEGAKEIAALTEEQRAEAETESARIFAPGAAMSKRIHKYNESGMLIETKQTMMGMETERQTLAYDKDGNKLEQVNYFGNGIPESRIIFTRDYDANGNWTKELVSIVSGSNKETELNTERATRRTFTYY